MEGWVSLKTGQQMLRWRNISKEMNDSGESWMGGLPLSSLFLRGSNDHHSIHPLSLLRFAAGKEEMSLVSTKSSNISVQAQEDFIRIVFV